jgi:uncharacterized membrane protein
MSKDKIFEYYKLRKIQINGALIGFIISIFILIIGAIKTLFIALCMGTGYYIGKRLSEDKQFLKKLLDRILPPGTYR